MFLEGMVAIASVQRLACLLAAAAVSAAVSAAAAASSDLCGRSSISMCPSSPPASSLPLSSYLSL